MADSDIPARALHHSNSARPVQLLDVDQNEEEDGDAQESGDPQRDNASEGSEEEKDRRVLTQSILSAEPDDICVFGAAAARTLRCLQNV